jgi:hypothetical protein
VLGRCRERLLLKTLVLLLLLRHTAALRLLEAHELCDVGAAAPELRHGHWPARQRGEPGVRAKQPLVRGLHSFTFQLNLSHV